MNIQVCGTGKANIEITTDRPFNSLNTPRDAALLAEALYWNLSQETLSRFMSYLTKKIMESEVEKHIVEIVQQGRPAISVVYPTGDRAVMTEEEVMDMLSRGHQIPGEHDDTTPDVVDDDDDYGIPDE